MQPIRKPGSTKPVHIIHGPAGHVALDGVRETTCRATLRYPTVSTVTAHQGVIDAVDIAFSLGIQKLGVLSVRDFIFLHSKLSGHTASIGY